jgi:hypothetical protein
MVEGTNFWICRFLGWQNTLQLGKHVNSHSKRNLSVPETIASKWVLKELVCPFLTVHNSELVNCSHQIICTGGQMQFDIQRSNNFKIGNYSLTNRFYSITKTIELNLLKLPYHFSKCKMNTLFIQYELKFCQTVVFHEQLSFYFHLVSFLYLFYIWSVLILFNLKFYFAVCCNINNYFV